MKQSDVDENQIWQHIQAKLKSIVTPQQYTTWFADLKLSKFDNRSIHINTPNLFCKDWLSNNYMDLISSTIKETLSSVSQVNLVVDEETISSKSTSPNKYRNPDPLDTKKHIYINKSYTFKDFLVGPCNRLAHAAALSVCESPGTNYNPLFIHGPVGLGKTHLLQAIYMKIQKRSGQQKALYLSCETFVNHYISTIKTGDWDSFRNTYRQIDVLLIDDVHFLANSQNSREEFFHTFNALYNRQKQIVMSSDCPPDEIPTIEDRLISRFRWGLITRIDPPSYETCIAIIQRKAAQRNLILTNDVISYLAENSSSSIREIESALLNIKKYASLSKNVIDLELAKLAVYGTIRKKDDIGIEKILGVITKHFSLQLSSLHSKRKLKSITLPRQIAMYLARKLTNLSLGEIGGYMGGRDHTTVMHAVEKIKNMKKKDQNVSNTLRRLEKELVS